MSTRPPLWQEDDELSADRLNQVSEAIESCSPGNPGGSSGGGVGSWGSSEASPQPERFWARAGTNDGGTPPGHAFQQILEDPEAEGGFTDDDGGVFSDLYECPLYEVNGLTVPEGTIVSAWRGVDDYYLCEYGGLSTVYSDVDVTFTDASTVTFEDSSELHLDNSSIVVDASSTIVIDASQSLTIEGPGSFVVEAPVVYPPYSLTISNGTNNNVSLDSVTSSVIRLTGPSAVWTITGLSLTGVTSGHSFTLLNATGFTGTIKHQDAGSTASFRIINPASTDITVPDGATFSIVQDGTSGRWKLAGASPLASSLTTAGDIYTYGSSAPARLGIGTANQMLGVVGAGGSHDVVSGAHAPCPMARYCEPTGIHG